MEEDGNALTLGYILSRMTTQFDDDMNNLLTGIIGSRTRIKLIVRLFFNPRTRSYLRELSKEFGVSTNAVREELNQLKQTHLVRSRKAGRHVYYMANENHPLFPELKSMVSKVMGIDQVIDGIVNRLGELEQAYLLDDYAEGKDTGIIDLLLVGKINEYQLSDLTKKTERYIKRRIRYLVMGREEYEKFLPKLKERPHVLVWETREKSAGW